MKGLKLFRTKDVDVYYTLDSIFGEDDDDIAKEMGIDPKNIELSQVIQIVKTSSIENFLNRNSNYTKLVNLNGKRNKLPKKHAILSAHGEEDSDDWYFHSEGNSYLVQDWINNQDGKYASLLLRCCNPNATEVHAKKSAILTPNATYGGVLHELGEVQIELYLPKIGYVNPYEEEAIIRDFKK